MPLYGTRCDLMIQARDENHLDEIMSNMVISITDNEGNPWDTEILELLVAENGPEYVLDENGMEIK